MVNDTAAHCATCHTTVCCCLLCCFSCRHTLLPVVPRHATADRIIVAALCPVVAVALPSVTPLPVVSGHRVIIAACGCITTVALPHVRPWHAAAHRVVITAACHTAIVLLPDNLHNQKAIKSPMKLNDAP